MDWIEKPGFGEVGRRDGEGDATGVPDDADRRLRERPTLRVVVRHLDPEPVRASDEDSEAGWVLATIVACVAMTVTATLGLQRLAGGYPWSACQILTPIMLVPTVIITAAIVRACLPGRRS